MTNEHEYPGIKRRRFLAMTGAAGGTTVLAGCSNESEVTETPGDDGGDDGTDSTPAEGQQGGTFIDTTGEGANTLDPRLEELAWVDTVINYIFDGLLIQAPDGSEFVDHLAAEHERVDDATHVFTLREGVTFHDGSELTAEDVAYTYNWILEPDNASPKRANLGFLDSVEATNTYEAQFNLNYEFALFEQEMQIPIVPKNAAEEMGSDEFGQNPVGTGPFKLAEWEDQDHITLERYDDHWLQTPNLDKITWRVIPEAQVQYVELATGNVHQSTVPHQLIEKSREQDNITMDTFPHFDYNALIFNTLKEPFDDVRVREAMQYVVNYDEIVQASKGELGDRVHGFMPKSVNEAWDFPWEEWDDEYFPERDHDTAQQLLDEAGYGDGFGETIQINSLSFEKFREMAIILQSELDEMGIDAEITEMTIGQWLTSLDEGDYHVNIYGWGGGQDPDGYYYYLFRDLRNDEGGMEEDIVGNASAGMLYQSNPDDEELQRADKIIREARTYTDRSERKPLYEEAAKIFQSRYPAIQTFTEQEAVAWSGSVQDYDPQPFSSQAVCNHWHNSWIEE